VGSPKVWEHPWAHALKWPSLRRTHSCKNLPFNKCNRKNGCRQIMSFSWRVLNAHANLVTLEDDVSFLPIDVKHRSTRKWHRFVPNGHRVYWYNHIQSHCDLWHSFGEWPLGWYFSYHTTISYYMQQHVYTLCVFMMLIYVWVGWKWNMHSHLRSPFDSILMKFLKLGCLMLDCRFFSSSWFYFLHNVHLSVFPNWTCNVLWSGLRTSHYAWWGGALIETLLHICKQDHLYGQLSIIHLKYMGNSKKSLYYIITWLVSI
jgi:hypothetical protein